MMNKNILDIRKYDYVFQMEPDVVPIRRGWAEEISILSRGYRYSNVDVIGSGQWIGHPQKTLNMNGNALYRSDGNWEEFEDWSTYEKTWKAYDESMSLYYPGYLKREPDSFVVNCGPQLIDACLRRPPGEMWDPITTDTIVVHLRAYDASRPALTYAAVKQHLHGSVHKHVPLEM